MQLKGSTNISNVLNIWVQFGELCATDISRKLSIVHTPYPLWWKNGCLFTFRNFTKYHSDSFIQGNHSAEQRDISKHPLGRSVSQIAVAWTFYMPENFLKSEKWYTEPLAIFILFRNFRKISLSNSFELVFLSRYLSIMNYLQFFSSSRKCPLDDKWGGSLKAPKSDQ